MLDFGPAGETKAAAGADAAPHLGLHEHEKVFEHGAADLLGAVRGLDGGLRHLIFENVEHLLALRDDLEMGGRGGRARGVGGVGASCCCFRFFFGVRVRVYVYVEKDLGVYFSPFRSPGAAASCAHLVVAQLDDGHGAVGRELEEPVGLVGQVDKLLLERHALVLKRKVVRGEVSCLAGTAMGLVL